MSRTADALSEHDRETALAMALALAGGWGAYAIFSAIASAWSPAALELGAMIATLGLWRWCSLARPPVARIAHLLSGLTALVLFALALASGQGASQAWWQLLLVPLIAASLLGARAGLVWCIPTGVLVGAVHLSGLLFPLPPMYVSTPWMRSFSGVLLTALALGYVMYARSLARRHLRTALERERTIFEQAAALEGAQSEVERARDEAVTALERKTEFLATLSHELRAPLNGLLGLSSVLLESRMAPQQAELVRTLQTSASSMRKILNDVLDLSRIESGRLELREESVDLRELIGEVLDVFAPAAADKGVELAAIVAPNVSPSLRVDPIRFGQVLTNLVNNALKFTPAGEIVVELTQKGSRLRMVVRDTGLGIAPEERERLFRPFEQTASGEGSREIGSGLGLWISQRIVEAMGGTIGLDTGLDSEMGADVAKGSAFFVEWDAEPGDQWTGDSIEIRVGLKLLVVEDHEASAHALRSIAKHLGFEAIVARSIGEATRLASRIDDLHAVLIDATMPGVTPVAAAEALRALPPLKRLPFVSAIAPSAERMRVGIELPYVASTLKPYRASRLVALLSDVLSPRPMMPTPVALSPWRPLDVLVVDDDSTNRMVAKLLLERAGLRPRPASSGEEALELLRSTHADVVLLDLHMTGIDGLETARRIRSELDPSRRLWIVALTASVYEEDRQRCLDAGMDDFIPKPIEIGLFRAALERAQRAVRRRATGTSSIFPAADDGVSARALKALSDALGDPGEVALLVADYRESSAALCAALRDAQKRSDARTAERSAHTLASSSGQLGAHRLEALARAVELAARKGELPDEPAVSRLEQERETALVTLEARLVSLIEPRG